MATRLISIAEDPKADASKLAHIIERDPAICASVLALANSAAHRRGQEVTRVQQAVSWLGFQNVANIAVGAASKSLFDVELKVQRSVFPRWWERLFHSSMTEAFTCAFVSMGMQNGSSASMFLTGLLHDVGKSLGLRSLASLVLAGELPKIDDDDLIDYVLSVNNPEFSAIALERFNLPRALVRLSRHQDDDEFSNGDLDAQVLRLVSALNKLRLGTLMTEGPLRRVQSAARALSFDQSRVLGVAQQLSEHSAQVGLLFSTSDDSDETGFVGFLERCLES